MIVFVSRDSDVISGQRNERKTFINLEDVDDLASSMKKKQKEKKFGRIYFEWRIKINCSFVFKRLTPALMSFGYVEKWRVCQPVAHTDFHGNSDIIIM